MRILWTKQYETFTLRTKYSVINVLPKHTGHLLDIGGFSDVYKCVWPTEKQSYTNAQESRVISFKCTLWININPFKGHQLHHFLDITCKIGEFNVYHKQNWTIVKHPELYTSHIFVTSILVMLLTGYLLLGISLWKGLISYNDTLKFVPTMEVSGNEKAKNVKYLPYMIIQIQPIDIQ